MKEIVEPNVTDSQQQSRERKVKYNYFGENLKLKLKEKKISYRKLAALCGVSTQHVVNTMYGQSAYNLKFLYSIQKALDLTTEQICELILAKDEGFDKSKGRYMTAVLIPHKNTLADSNRPYGGQIKNYYENDLKDKYSDYAPQSLKDFVIKELADSYYGKELDSMASEIDQMENFLNIVSFKIKNNKDFCEILEMLQCTDDTKISYIKEAIKLYLSKH